MAAHVVGLCGHDGHSGVGSFHRGSPSVYAPKCTPQSN
jgi:hypothetical protein